jgi:hypothetical protein
MFENLTPIVNQGIDPSCFSWCKNQVDIFIHNEGITNLYFLVAASVLMLYQVAYPIIEKYTDEKYKKNLENLYNDCPIFAFFLICAYIVISVI